MGVSRGHTADGSALRLCVWEATDSLVERAKHELSFAYSRMRHLQPSHAILVLLVADITDHDRLVTVEQQIEIDDPRTVAERLCPADLPLRTLQETKQVYCRQSSLDLPESDHRLSVILA